MQQKALRLEKLGNNKQYSGVRVRVEEGGILL